MLRKQERHCARSGASAVRSLATALLWLMVWCAVRQWPSALGRRSCPCVVMPRLPTRIHQRQSMVALLACPNPMLRSCRRAPIYPLTSRPSPGSRPLTSCSSAPVVGEVFALRFREFGAHIFFSGPAAHKEIFNNGSDDFSASDANLILRNVMGSESLFSLDGRRHMSHRKAMTPCFAPARVCEFARVIAEETQVNLTSKMDGWPCGKPAPMLEFLLDLSLNVMFRLLFGNDRNELIGHLRRQVKKLMALISTGAVLRESSAHVNTCDPRRLFQILRRDIYQTLFMELDGLQSGTDARASGLAEEICRGAGSGRMSRDAIADQLLTLLIAGHETTASALAWALHWICQTEGVCSRILKEIDDIGVERHFGDGVELPYLDAVCRETLRISPVVPIIARVARQQQRVRAFWFLRGACGIGHLSDAPPCRFV